ncbi:MAG: succinylglutamate desuccinylase/aspartoacylase family protein [Verrucomicrobiae bacterium]|nr:succinylglutamate desuccinylase/aspartoacylase family protein [Verrucomicrobiae bacterium]
MNSNSKWFSQLASRWRLIWFSLPGVLLTLAIVIDAKAQPITPSDIKVRMQNRRTWSFPAAGVYFTSEFSGARLNGCEHLGGNEFKLVISPENIPINRSPWYAFKIWSDLPKTVTLRFTYTYGEPRTRPWLSHDGDQWKEIANADYAVESASRTAVVKLDVTPQPLWVAAQEMIGLKELSVWTDAKMRLKFARSSIIGRSIEGRPIRQLIFAETTIPNYVFIMGRQHPPEVTGSLGLMSFVDTITGNSRLARQFRREFQTVVVPLVNPDGVEHGHWRSNLGAVDLNRDWRPFAQPETRAVRDSFLSLGEQPGAQPFLLVDFHSTHTNIFYAQPDQLPIFPADFTRRWRAAIHERCPEIHFRRDDSHNVGSATSKAWGYEQFRVPAITYEYGYDTDRKLIRQASQVAAEEMMKLLLAELHSPQPGRRDRQSP